MEYGTSTTPATDTDRGENLPTNKAELEEAQQFKAEQSPGESSESSWLKAWGWGLGLGA